MVTRKQILKLHITGSCCPAWHFFNFHLTQSIVKC
jgi:hypothetical protein